MPNPPDFSQIKPRGESGRVQTSTASNASSFLQPGRPEQYAQTQYGHATSSALSLQMGAGAQGGQAQFSFEVGAQSGQPQYGEPLEDDPLEDDPAVFVQFDEPLEDDPAVFVQFDEPLEDDPAVLAQYNGSLQDNPAALDVGAPPGQSQYNEFFVDNPTMSQPAHTQYTEFFEGDCATPDPSNFLQMGYPLVVASL
jgi:hypothetical protein